MAIKVDEDVFDSLFTLMAKSIDDADEEVTLLDIKQNLNVYSIKKLKRLASVLIDSLCELAAEKDFLNKSPNIFQNEKIALTTQMSEIEERFASLDVENLDLKKKLKKIPNLILKKRVKLVGYS